MLNAVNVRSGSSNSYLVEYVWYIVYVIEEQLVLGQFFLVFEKGIDLILWIFLPVLMALV